MVSKLTTASIEEHVKVSCFAPLWCANTYTRAFLLLSFIYSQRGVLVSVLCTKHLLILTLVVVVVFFSTCICMCVYFVFCFLWFCIWFVLLFHKMRYFLLLIFRLIFSMYVWSYKFGIFIFLLQLSTFIRYCAFKNCISKINCSEIIRSSLKCHWSMCLYNWKKNWTFLKH